MHSKRPLSARLINMVMHRRVNPLSSPRGDSLCSVCTTSRNLWKKRRGCQTGELWTDRQTDSQTARQRDRQVARQADSQTARLAGSQTGRQRDRQTARQADRGTGRQPDRQTDRQADSKTSRQGR